MKIRPKSGWTSWLIVAVVMVGIPLAFLYEARTLTGGAEIVPRLMAGMMGCTALISLVNRLRAADGEASRSIPFLRAGIVVIAVALYLFAIPLLGFYVSSGLALLGAILMFSPKITPGSVLTGLLCAVLFSLVAWFIFYDTLMIMTPEGIWF